MFMWCFGLLVACILPVAMVYGSNFMVHLTLKKDSRFALLLGGSWDSATICDWAYIALLVVSLTGLTWVTPVISYACNWENLYKTS